MINVLIETTGEVVARVSFILLIAIYVWMGYETNTELIFYLLQLFKHLSNTFGSTLPANFTKTAQLYACIIRLNEVLQADEITKCDTEYYEKPSIILENVCYHIGNKTILNGITMSITNPGLTIVTGPVGSGKSSLLKIILRDYQPLMKGK